MGSAAPFASPTLSAPPGSCSAAGHGLGWARERRPGGGCRTLTLAGAQTGPPLAAGLFWEQAARPPPYRGRGLTSPPVRLGQVVPGLMLGVVSAARAQVRSLDKPPAPVGLQHHLQLGEGLAVPLPPLVIQRSVAHHVAGGRLADFTLDITLGARRVRLALVRQVAQDGLVAFLA